MRAEATLLNKEMDLSPVKVVLNTQSDWDLVTETRSQSHLCLTSHSPSQECKLAVFLPQLALCIVVSYLYE